MKPATPLWPMPLPPPPPLSKALSPLPPHAPRRPPPPRCRAGPVRLEGLRINQLAVARSLEGELALTEPRLLLRARGGRSDEVLEVDLALPQQAQHAQHAQQAAVGAGSPGGEGRRPADVDGGQRASHLLLKRGALHVSSTVRALALPARARALHAPPPGRPLPLACPSTPGSRAPMSIVLTPTPSVAHPPTHPLPRAPWSNRST